MNATLSTSEQSANALARAHRWLSFLKPAERLWLRSKRKVYGRFFEWDAGDQAALLQDALIASGDAETYIQEACVFTPADAAEMLDHIACGDDAALGRFMREKIMREYHELMVDVVDEA